VGIANNFSVLKLNVGAVNRLGDGEDAVVLQNDNFAVAECPGDVFALFRGESGAAEPLVDAVSV
jgi:hypothetical protein